MEKKVKALELIEKNETVQEKAPSFVKSAKEHCWDILRNKKKWITQIEDEIAEKESNLIIATDMNKGMIQQSRSQVSKTFEELIDLRRSLTLAQEEMDLFKEGYLYYFSEEVSETI